MNVTVAEADVWTTRKLREVADTASGGTPSRSKPEYYGGDIPWVKSGELEDGYITDTEEKITAKAIEESSAKIFEMGTLLIALYGATVGRTSILCIDAATNQAVCAIKPKIEMNVEFLRFYLMYIRPVLLNARHGGAQPNISQTLLKNIDVSYPAKSEQDNIGLVLCQVRKAIDVQERIMEKTRELKKSLMQKLFTEGLRGEELKETEIGPIPKSWSVVTLGREGILKASQYGLSKRGLLSGQYPVLRMNALMDGHVEGYDLQYIDLDEKDFNRFKVDRYDLMFNRTNSIDLVGKTGLFDLPGDYVFASYLIRLKVDAEIMRPWFLNLYLNMDDVQRRLKGLATRGVSQSNISASRLKTFKIPLPPDTNEQDEIVRSILAVDEKVKSASRRKEVLQSLFQSMLSELMTGRIRVIDLEVSDE